MEADWAANTVGVTFYNGDTQFDTASCTYDGTLTLPSTDPTKTGYTFDGWKVRRAAAQCSLSGLNTSTPGTAYAFINFDGTESTVSGSYQKAASTYNLTTPGEWATEFSYGTIKGTSRCSTVGSGYNRGQNGEPTDNLNQTGAQYCWCKVTDFITRTFIPDSNDNIYLIGYSNKTNCIKAVRAINGMGVVEAKTFVDAASEQNPQLIAGATSAHLDALSTDGCITSGGLNGHNEDDICPVVASLWVFFFGNGSAASCASNCASICGSNARGNEALRVGLFGSSN